MEFLKEILGNELYQQVFEKIKGSGVELADLSEGKHVEKNKLLAAEQKATELEKQLSEANKQIEGFKSMDIEGIKKAADDWEAKYKADIKAANDRIAATEYDSILRDSLSNVKFSSELAKKAAFHELKAKGLKRENDKILGLDDAIKALKESDIGAFIPDMPDQQKQLPSGMKLFQPDGSGAAGGGVEPKTLNEAIALKINNI